LPQAMENLSTAIISHLEALQEIDKLNEVGKKLRDCARQRSVTVCEMAANEPLVRFNAGIQDHRVVAIA
jgi:hypothetical protein